MSEKSPNLEKKPDPFRYISRRIHPDVLRNVGLNEKELQQAADTFIAFTLTKEFHDEYKQPPSEWRSLGYARETDASANFSRETRFLFVRAEDGVATKKETRSFSSPSAFFVALQEFHKLDPVTDAQKRSAEIGAMWRGRMPGGIMETQTSDNATTQPGVHPVRPIRTIKPTS